MNCSCCQNVNDLDNTFDLESAREEAADYRQKGLSKRERKFVALFAGRLSDSADLLEVGGGAGAIQHELLRDGKIQHVTGIDASSGYLTAAGENAEHFELADRVDYRHADFALDDGQVDSAELVILDRVICCYPDLDSLLGKAATRASNLLAISYPIDRWYTRTVVAVINAGLTLFGSGYHPYVHRQEDIDEIAANAGLKPAATVRHTFWRHQLYERIPT